MAGQAKLYNAPSGREMKAFIMKEISDAFDNIHDFTTDAITFPVTRWTWKLDLQCYPRDPTDIKVQAAGEHISADATPTELAAPLTPIELTGQDAIGAEGMTPVDLAREQAGLPIPTVTLDRKTGAMFDRMVQKEPTDEESWHPPGARSAVIDRSSGRGGAKK